MAEDKPKGARAKIEVEGGIEDATAERVLKAAAGNKDGGSVATATKAAFSKAVRNLDYRIFARRLSPQTLPDGANLGDEMEIPVTETLTEQEIIREISEARGGRRWHVRVVDEDDRPVSAKVVTVPGEPRLAPGFADDLGFGEQGGGEMEPGDPGDALEATLAADKDVIEAEKGVRLAEIEARKRAKQAEQEESDARIDEAKLRRDRMKRGLLPGEEPPHTNGNARKDDDLAAAIDKANAPLRDELKRYQERDRERDSKDATKQMIEASVGPMNKALEAIQQQLRENATRKPEGRPVEELLRELQRDMKADTAQQIQTMLGQIKSELTGKVDSLAQTVATLNNTVNQLMLRPPAAASDGGIAGKAIDALGKIAAKEGAAPADPFSGLERATNVMKNLAETKSIITGGTSQPTDFKSLVVEKIGGLSDRVVDVLEKRAGAGVSEDQIKGMFKEYGEKLWGALDATIKAEVRGAAARQTGAPPPGGVPHVVAAPGVQQGPPPPGVVAAPGVVPAPGVVVPAPQPSPVTVPPSNVPQIVPAAAPGAPMTPAQRALAGTDVEKRKRVDWVMAHLLRELDQGIIGMTWPKKAVDNLPKDILDKIVDAAKDTEVYVAVKPHADPQLLDSIWAYLADSHPNAKWNREWMNAGINWIKDALAPEEPGGEIPREGLEDGPPV